MVCGINDYESKPNLCGAVADATDVLHLLVTSYQVPRDQIHLLINKDASRAGIISALDGLSKDPRIERGDPILFYFAGHGSEIPPPKGWECGGPGRNIQILVSQDYCSEPGLKIPGIPDRTIGFLLDKIAHSKGDNIVSFHCSNDSEALLTLTKKTVILDCCHAASGTRGETVRSVEVDPSIHTNALDKDIWDERAPQCGLTSHVLLAACLSSEIARERDGRGAFTTELLHLLREVPPNELRYRDILHKMRPISR